ncbi:hypothetical protein JTB14_012410 [Gonioctena quinquepunctata]|nr:hypothetical protein JTB14_012410 [Gonioctena quinquepunctata]
MEQKVMNHPLGLSEVDKTAGVGGAGHGSSRNSIKSQSDDNKDRNQKELTQNSTEIKDNSDREGTNFAKPRRMRRRSRLVRAPQTDEAKTARRLEVQKLKKNSQNKQCECEGTKENHKYLTDLNDISIKAKCIGSIASTEQETGCTLISEADMLDVQGGK